MSATNNTRTGLLSAALVCLLVASQAAGQDKPGSAPNELHYNGDNGNNKQLDDTNIIEDTTSPTINNQDNYARPRPRPSNNQFGLGGGADDTSLERPSQPFPDFGSFGLPLFGGNGGGLFGGLQNGNNGFAPPSPLPRPFTILDNLFGNIRRHTENFHENFERQFRDLERHANGVGQEVSYFNRNGVAYMKNCTITRISPGGEDQIREPQQVEPMGVFENDQQQVPQQRDLLKQPEQLTPSQGLQRQSSQQQQQQSSSNKKDSETSVPEESASQSS